MSLRRIIDKENVEHYTMEYYPNKWMNEWMNEFTKGAQMLAKFPHKTWESLKKRNQIEKNRVKHGF